LSKFLCSRRESELNMTPVTKKDEG
jgi:hypothetical protein